MSTATARGKYSQDSVVTNTNTTRLSAAGSEALSQIRKSPWTQDSERISGRVIEIGLQDGDGDLSGRKGIPTGSRGADDRLLNARQVAAKLGVSERWVRDHTTRRSPKIRGVKLGTLMRYRQADVEVFMQELDTLAPSRRSRFGV